MREICRLRFILLVQKCGDLISMRHLITLCFVLFCFGIFTPAVGAHTETQVIKMVPGGFEPQEATIDENSAVIFVNQDTIGRWPASNNHPTHELYPEFDPKREIAPGESWAFKPKSIGGWKYHDHVNPHLRGVLTVLGEGKSEKVAEQSKSFSLKDRLRALFQSVKLFFSNLTYNAPAQEKFKKLAPEEQFEQLEKIAKVGGAGKGWAYLQDTYRGQAGSSGNIHDLAHLSGRLIFEDKGLSGISTCTSTFAFGCYHGLLDVAFSDSLEGLLTAEKECSKLGNPSSGPYGSCVHGIGHGVASYYDSRDLEKSLESCNTLSAGQAFCHDGVFMEFARGARGDFYLKVNPFYPCNTLETRFGGAYSVACGRNQPTIFISKFGMNFDQAAMNCVDNTLSKDFKVACVDALGFMLAGSKDTRSIISGCQSIGLDEYTANCLKAAAGELIFQDVPGWQQAAPEVCAASPVSAKTTCSQYLEKLIKDYGRS